MHGNPGRPATDPAGVASVRSRAIAAVLAIAGPLAIAGARAIAAALAIAGPLAIAAALAIAACAPPIDGPVDHQRAIDRDDGDRLAGQLALLPGVVAASVVLHHATRDPLAVTPPRPATVTAVITVDDQADPAAIRGAAARLAHATLPELAADAALPIEINAGVHRPTLARVGPFSVEQSSRAALKATLAIGCLAIAGLAGAVALRARRHRLGNSAQ